MSGQEFESPENEDPTRITRREKVSAEEPPHTEAIEAESPAPTRFFEVPDATKSLEAEPAERIDWTDPPASLDPPNPPVPVPTPEPAFRPENESTDPAPGFVGYITRKRGPEIPSAASPQPESAPAGPPPASSIAPVMDQAMTDPGIRTRTVIIGLILLAVGISALITQLGGISLHPAAVALTVMLAAGVTLVSAAIKRSQKQ